MAQTSGQDKAIAALNQINSIIIELNPNGYSLVIMSAFVFHQRRIHVTISGAAIKVAETTMNLVLLLVLYPRYDTCEKVCNF
jgi:hypothetical protein